MAVQFNAFTDRYKPFIPALVPRQYDSPTKALNGLQFALPIAITYLDIDEPFKLKRVCRFFDCKLDSEVIAQAFPHFAKCQKVALATLECDCQTTVLKRPFSDFDLSLPWSVALPDTNFFVSGLYKNVKYSCHTDQGSKIYSLRGKIHFIGKNDTHLYFLEEQQKKSNLEKKSKKSIVPFSLANCKYESPLPLILGDKTPLHLDEPQLTIDFVYGLIESRQKCFFDQNNVTIISIKYEKRFVVKLLITDQGIHVQHWEETEKDSFDLAALPNCGLGSLHNWQRFCVIPLEKHLYTAQLVLLNGVDNRVLSRVPLRTKVLFDGAFVSADDAHMAVQYSLGTRPEGGSLANLDVYDHTGKPKIQISDCIVRKIQGIWMSQGFLIYEEAAKDDSTNLIMWSVWLKRYVKKVHLPKDMGIQKILRVDLVENQKEPQEIRILALVQKNQLYQKRSQGEKIPVSITTNCFAVISLMLSQPQTTQKKV